MTSLITIISSCKDLSDLDKGYSGLVNKESPIHKIEILALGLADSPNTLNRGYSLPFYAYFNLNSDSVFIRQKFDLEDKPIIVHSGNRKDLFKDKILADMLALIKNLKPGSFIRRNALISTLYCGKDYALIHTYGEITNRYYFRRNSQHSEFGNFADYAEKILLNNKETSLGSNINENKILVNIVSKPDFIKFMGVLPPKISTVKFTPPIIKSEKELQ